MCTSIVEVVGAEGMAKRGDEWFVLTQAVVAYDHARHAPLGDVITLDFINVGLVPDGGAAWLLLRRLGYGRTFEVLAEGKPLDARRCLEAGIANRVVAPDELRETALQWASELAARAPMALALTKRLARLSQEISLADAMALEGEMQTLFPNHGLGANLDNWIAFNPV